MPVLCPRGPVMVDIAGFSLSDAERERLRHPLVGAVILFRRNFQSLAQLRALTAEIHALRSPALIIAVDHEGGRVQRFLEGFTRLPSMRTLGALWADSPPRARATAQAVGEVLAAELRASYDDLEAQVYDRTEALASANAELERQRGDHDQAHGPALAQKVKKRHERHAAARTANWLAWFGYAHWVISVGNFRCT